MDRRSYPGVLPYSTKSPWQLLLKSGSARVTYYYLGGYRSSY